MNELILEDYHAFLKQIKERIATSQTKAALAVSRELIELYWQIGSSLLQKQERNGWGSQVIDRLAKDLKSTFPRMQGFSKRNLFYMKQFASSYSQNEIMQQPVALIPWGHNVVLLDKLEAVEQRIWYAKKTLENGWSRNALIHWIDSGLYKRQGKAITNFQHTLPTPHSDLAEQALKDPYCFDFLTLHERFEERELEDGLLDHIQRFLLELGAGFAFVGRQVLLKVGDQDFYVDLLFYHFKLRCFFVVELKATEFKPEHVGKMGFYLTAIDKLMKHPDDAPTIGLLLCKTKNRVIAEYALRTNTAPIGVAEYETKIIESLPDNLKGSLPSIEELEQEFEGNS